MIAKIDRIKVSQKGKEELSKLKRTTKIENWNILCRWAFCRSLADSSKPPVFVIPQDSNLEMSWQTFGGEIADILHYLLVVRCYQDGLTLDQETFNQQFKLHLHRGITYLLNDPNVQSLEELLSLGIDHS